MDEITIIELNKLIQICQANLNKNHKCLKYLIEERKLNIETINEFNLGYFPQNIDKLIKYVSPLILQKLSIIDYSEKSSFSDFFSLIFPIYSEDKTPIGIGGRTLLNEEERAIYNIPKYKNSSYQKSSFLYGLDQSIDEIIKQNSVYVVEGFFDKISLHSNNIKNSVAICGTSFSKKHFLKIIKYANKINFILDNDSSGLIAMEKIYKKYSNLGIVLRFYSLPKEYKDVDEYFKYNKKNNLLEDLKDYFPF